MQAPVEYTAADETARNELKRSFAALGAGELDALEPIWEACSDRLYALALWRTGSAADAEDVLQDVFVRLTRERAKLADVRDPFAWLATVTHRASIDVHRRRQRRQETTLEACAFVVADETSPERKVDAARVASLLAEIPAAQREAIVLKHYADESFASIGRITGVTKFTAASRYRLGMRRLRRHLRLQHDD